MMFLAHIAYSTSVVTLVLGFALLAWSKKDAQASGVLKTGGIIVLVMALLNMLCISYYMVRYWEDGYFKAPAIISYSQQGGMGMMQKGEGMMKCPMMQDMMKGMNQNVPGMLQKSEIAPSAEDHEAHH